MHQPKCKHYNRVKLTHFPSSTFQATGQCQHSSNAHRSLQFILHFTHDTFSLPFLKSPATFREKKLTSATESLTKRKNEKRRKRNKYLYIFGYAAKRKRFYSNTECEVCFQYVFWIYASASMLTKVLWIKSGKNSTFPIDLMWRRFEVRPANENDKDTCARNENSITKRIIIYLKISQMIVDNACFWTICA